MTGTLSAKELFPEVYELGRKTRQRLEERVLHIIQHGALPSTSASSAKPAAPTTMEAQANVLG